MQLETLRLTLHPLSRSDEAEIAVLPFTRPSIGDVAWAGPRTSNTRPDAAALSVTDDQDIDAAASEEKASITLCR
jgi:hypothetical protein